MFRVGFFIVLVACVIGGNASLHVHPQKRVHDTDSCGSRIRIECNHLVVGAGPVGSYMAWQLKKRFPQRDVCLFEANAEPGGRFNDSLYNGDRIPNGGMRWREFGNYTMAIFTRLADELGITRDADVITDFIGSTSTGARGGFVRANQNLVQWYNPSMPFRTAIPGCNTQCQSIASLVAAYNANVSAVAQFGNFRNFIQRHLSDESAEFLRDMERLRSYHDDIADAPFFMDTYLWQARYDSVRSYPDFGMSEFPRRMVDRFKALGGRFFPNTHITAVDETSGIFTLLSEKYYVIGSQLTMAIPQQNYQSLQGGNVVDRLRQTPEFQSTTPTPAVTIQQVWPTRFWESLNATDNFRQGQMGSTAGYGNYAHVFTPSTRYAYNRNITRTVYVDDLIKVVFWENLYKTQGIAGVEAEAVRFLQGLMPNATIPKPTYTHYFYTPTFHAMQKAGSHARGLTNAHILNWATRQPLATISPCKLTLASDVWNPRMVGWAMAGWQIVIDWFQRCESITIDPAIDYCKPYTQPPLSRTWCDCRPGVPIPEEGLRYIETNCPRTKRDEVDTFVPVYGSKDE